MIKCCDGITETYRLHRWAYIDYVDGYEEIKQLFNDYIKSKSNKSIVKMDNNGEYLGEYQDIHLLVEEGFDKRTVYMCCDLKNKISSCKEHRFMYKGEYDNENIG
jgi:hypothetical protein